MKKQIDEGRLTENTIPKELQKNAARSYLIYVAIIQRMGSTIIFLENNTYKFLKVESYWGNFVYEYIEQTISKCRAATYTIT